MKIIGENQMRKLKWTQTITTILLIQTEKFQQVSRKQNIRSNRSIWDSIHFRTFFLIEHISSKSNISVLS